MKPPKTDTQSADVTLPASARGPGRPARVAAGLHYEEHHKQQRILQAIEQASGMTASQLEREFERGSEAAGNAGKSWRSWAQGKRLCNSLASIVARARKRGWVDEETEALFRYIDAKKSVYDDISKRHTHFAKAQREMLDALQAFRRICEQEHNAWAASQEVPPLSIRCGQDEDSYTSFPLNGEEIEGMFAKAEAALHALARLELNLEADMGADPQTGKAFSLGLEYRRLPSASRR